MRGLLMVFAVLLVASTVIAAVMLSVLDELSAGGWQVLAAMAAWSAFLGIAFWRGWGRDY